MPRSGWAGLVSKAEYSPSVVLSGFSLSPTDRPANQKSKEKVSILLGKDVAHLPWSPRFGTFSALRPKGGGGPRAGVACGRVAPGSVSNEDGRSV